MTTLPEASRPMDGRLKMIGRGRLSGSVIGSAAVVGDAGIGADTGRPVAAFRIGVTTPVELSSQAAVTEAGSKKGVGLDGHQLAMSGLVTCARQILPSVSLKKTRSTMEPSLGRNSVGRAAMLFFAGSRLSSGTQKRA